MQVDMMDAGTQLYRETLAYNSGDPERDALMREVWSPTPFMMDCFTGSMREARYYDMLHWCCERFGRQASPIHEIDGDWQTGGATIHGWTWYGFKTAEMLQEFMDAWPAAASATA